MNPFIAEVVGTMLLVLMGVGVVANVVLTGTKGSNSGWIVITTGWALGAFVGVVVAGPYSGAHLNPAVTVALAMAGKFSWAQVPAYVLAQTLGAALGAFLVWISYWDHFNATEDCGAKLGAFCTNPAIRNFPVNLLCEAIGTLALVLVILYMAGPTLGDAQRTPIGLGSIGAVPVAFLVWAIGLALGGTTGFAINPARDFAPRFMHAVLPIRGKGSSDWSYAWVPIVGPLAGGAAASLLYRAIS